MKNLAIATAALGLAFTASPALAGSNEYQSMDVSYAGLDLSTIEGQRLLEQRVEIAARKVCGYDDRQVGTLIRSKEVRDCVANARASARQDVATILQERQRGG